MKNYYEILGLSKNATQEEIKKAYRVYASKFHPDKYPENTKFAEDMMKQINIAFETLSDSLRKKSYDEWLELNSSRETNSDTEGKDNKENQNENKKTEEPKNYSRIISGVVFLIVAILLIIIFQIKNTNNQQVVTKNTRGVNDESTHLEKDCKNNNFESCIKLGLMYDNGVGVRQDKFKSVEFFTKACDGGDTSGCYILGMMYENGEGVRQDKSKALQLFGKACDMKLEDGCKYYATLKNQGIK